MGGEFLGTMNFGGAANATLPISPDRTVTDVPEFVGQEVETTMSVSGGPVDRATLEDLAAASRILVDQGVFDAAGHVSMRQPNHPERFLMSRSLAPQMVTADDIMEFDLDCNAVEPRGRNGFIERYLHGEIFRARPDVMAVAHSHSPSVTTALLRFPALPARTA